jgi:hypothetical protein
MENIKRDEIHRSAPRRQPSTAAAAQRRGQLLGFGALALMLAAIVTLAALGQAWVAGLVASTGGLPVIVPLFVTGQYRPTPGKTKTGLLRGPQAAEHKDTAGPPAPDVPSAPE